MGQPDISSYYTIDSETQCGVSCAVSMTSNITAAAAHSGSHCWEQDGSFHSVCIFVISVSLVCSLVTVVTAWRVAAMVASALRSDWWMVTSH